MEEPALIGKTDWGLIAFAVMDSQIQLAQLMQMTVHLILAIAEIALI